ncbi:MAG: shikimate dehydrogenase family protein [Ktedonobacterales bacterium]
MSDLRRAGLIGMPVAHSRSPVMQQAAFDALGLAARYELWETPPEALAARIASLRAPGMLGANVTVPYKLAVVPLLDSLGTEVRTLGSVNTIVRVADAEGSGGALLGGHNTDVAGLRRALREAGAQLAGKRMLVLGAGGAARAALAVARMERARVRIAARRPTVAADALGSMPMLGAGDIVALGDTSRLAALLGETDVLVNATPVGTLDAAAAPLPLDLLDRLPLGAFIFDLVYNPPETALVRAARARSLRASGGLPMLLYQGAEAFTLWTRQPAPLAAMRAALGIAEETTR